jgi:hypothetical protein
VQGTVVAGGKVTASMPLTLQAAFPAGVYPISASYVDDTGVAANYSPSNSPAPGQPGSAALTVGSVATNTTLDANSTAPSVTFSSVANHTVTLTAHVSATVSGATVMANEGAVTFTVGTGANTLTATSTTPPVNGTFTATLTVPANFPAGSYGIVASYSDSPANFGASDTTASPGTLTVQSADSSVSVTGGASVTFSTNSQTVMLTAAVSSNSGGPVKEGTVTFVVGDQSAVGKVSPNGTASAVLTLPGNFAAGTYTINATFADPNGNGSADFMTNSNSAATLTVAPVTSTTTITGVTLTPTFGGLVETITAKVNGPNGPVSGGTVTFSIGGTTVKASVSNGTAVASVSVSAFTALGPQGITASFGNSGNFMDSSFSRTAVLNFFSAFFPTSVVVNADGTETVMVDLFFFVPVVFRYNASGSLIGMSIAGVTLF